MKTILQKTVSILLLLSAILTGFILPVMQADASFEIPGTCQVQTDAGVAAL